MKKTKKAKILFSVKSTCVTFPEKKSGVKTKGFLPIVLHVKVLKNFHQSYYTIQI